MSDAAHYKHKSLNLIQLPQIGGRGYESYSPAENQFGTKQTIDAVIRIAADYFRNQGLPIQIGDLSFKDGGKMSPHISHRDGRCADIRPVRLDKKMTHIDIHHVQYDRPGTEVLIRALLAHRNVKKILFNDKAIEGVHWFKGHDNHIHVTFHH